MNHVCHKPFRRVRRCRFRRLLHLRGPRAATLEVQESPVNSTYKAVMRVGHGCEVRRTLKLRVRIPEGVIAVKPMLKPGWTLETVQAKYAKSYDYFGTPTAEGVQEIVWTGKLLDAHYDEFIFRARLTDSLPVGKMLYFPTVQECEGGKAERWIEIPAAGERGRLRVSRSGPEAASGEGRPRGWMRGRSNARASSRSRHDAAVPARAPGTGRVPGAQVHDRAGPCRSDRIVRRTRPSSRMRRSNSSSISANPSRR